MTIDWEPLVSVEARFLASDITSNSSRYFSGRLDRLYSCHDDDYEFESTEISVETLISHYLDKQHEGLYNDIPRQQHMHISNDELLLWSALISDFREAATKIPVYTSMMVVNGIPPCLRGLAWLSMAEAKSPALETLYSSLSEEWTPFVKIIGRDLNRTFPELTMFQQNGGKGQMMLGRILRAYSAYDIQVGYCQGFTFLTGPLLLHMSEKEAFCVLVRLMESYELRSMFTADMAGLHLRIYQFEHLFEEHLPELWQHFESLGINSVYATQWFLSFFAVTCPLDILVRIYDVLFAEGAIPTMFRVALSVLRRNQKILLNFEDEEPILERLLGPCLWDVYGYDANLISADIAEFDVQLLDRIDSLQTKYVADGRNKLRAVKRSKSTKANGNGRGLTSSPSGMYRLASWLSNSTSTLMNGSPSAADVTYLSPNKNKSTISIDSTASFPEESDDAHSTAESAQSESTRTSTSMMNLSVNNVAIKHSHRSSQTEYLENQLAMMKVTLELERQDRQCDAAAVKELLDIIEKGSLSGEAKFQCSQLRRRFESRCEDDDDHENTLVQISSPDDNACKSCERLTMEYAVMKAREATARQEVDMLTDRLARVSVNEQMSSPPTSPTETERRALSRRGSKVSSIYSSMNHSTVGAVGGGSNSNGAASAAGGTMGQTMGQTMGGAPRTLLQPLPQKRWSIMRK